jgi:hypothetical protein
VGIAVIVAVILLTGGVVAGSNTPDTLTFFGVIVRTTSAQVFLTGAICTWALLAAAWLLSVGLRRSRERGEELAALKARGRASRSAREPVRPPALFELLGFAPPSTRNPAGPGRPDGTAASGQRGVAERPGLRPGSGGAGAEQDPPEEPPRR